MTDRTVYAHQISEYQLFYDYYPYTDLVDYYSYEFLWGFLLRKLHDSCGLSVEFIFFAISFVFIFVAALIVVRCVHYLYLLFLVNPLVVDLAFSQLRVALAAALLGLALIVVRRYVWLRFGAVLAAVLIHSAAPIFLLSYAVAIVVHKRLFRRPYVGLFLLLFCGFSIGLLIGPLRFEILSILGDRRAEYGDLSSSLTFLLPWLILLLLAVLDWPEVGTTVENRIAVIILAVVATNMFTGAYSTRFLAVAFPVMLCLLSSLSRRLMSFPVLAFFVYACMQWILWSQS